MDAFQVFSNNVTNFFTGQETQKDINTGQEEIQASQKDSPQKEGSRSEEKSYSRQKSQPKIQTSLSV